MVLLQQPTVSRHQVTQGCERPDCQCLKQPMPIGPPAHQATLGLVQANLVREGYLLYEAARYESALQCFDQAVGAGHELELALHGRGLVYAKLYRYAAALRDFNRALRFDGDDAQLWYNHGMALSHLRRHREAIQSFDRSTQLDPNNHHAWYNRARSLRACRCYHGALDNLNRVVDLKADCHYALSYRGIILAAMARYHEAIKSFNASLHLNDRDFNAWCGKAHAALRLNDINSAIHCLYQTLKLSPIGYQQIVHNRREFDAIRSDQRFIDLVADLA